MPLRVVGAKVLLQPVVQTQKSAIVLTDPDPPTVGRVIGVGRERCPDCERHTHPDYQIGDVVLVRASSGQRITMDGEEVWVVPMQQILSFWKPDEEPAHV